ncbi:hypothetical protein JVU11DRAFT_132 [Chiua virens]|nr:hypothetical protein JVU11DRAFT_132 [Chiua virens]
MQASIAQRVEESRSNRYLAWLCYIENWCLTRMLTRWNALIKESEATIGKYLVPDINVNLGEFLRCAAFRVFLVVFLGVDPDTLAYANVQLVTGAIAEYYKDREGKSALAPDVQSIFNEWLSPERFPSSLDNIIPAYEALWRIAATIVVKCEEDETKVSRWIMLDFRDNPRDRQYTASFGHGKSASAITEDAFGRLTPIVRPLYATAQNWPLDCIQYAATSEDSPTVQEALKFAGIVGSHGRWSSWSALRYFW